MTTLFTPKNNSTHSKPNLFQSLKAGVASIQSYVFSTFDVSGCAPGFAEIERLVELLVQEPGVESARAVAHKPGSLHEVTIEVLSYLTVPEQRLLREKAINLATEVEWKLSDQTQTEDWYFDAKVTRRFDSNLGQSWLVTSRDAGSQCLSATS